MNAPTPWARGRFDRGNGPKALLFGRMYEDHGIERATFAAGGRVFSIASAGCTAMALCETHAVTAVDINPVQAEYAAARFAGAPRRVGAAERVMGIGRGLLPLLGWSRSRVEHFLDLDDPPAQLAWFAQHLDGWRFRTVVDAAFSLTALGRVYGNELLSVLPPRFGEVMRGRLLRCIGSFPNRGNPWLRALVLGDDGLRDVVPAAAAGIELVCTDAVEWLERSAAGSYDGFTLSNILDGAPPAFAERLRCAVRHAAAPGASVVLRSFRDPGPRDDSRFNLAKADRSVLWGVVDVRPVADWV